VTATSVRAPASPARDDFLLLLSALVAAGIGVWWVSLAHQPGWWMVPVDMVVYLNAGQIVRGVPPAFNPRLASPLYDWPGPAHLHGLLFTYPPFSALLFSPMAFLRPRMIAEIETGLDILALIAVMWIAFRSLGVRAGPRRISLTLLATAAALFLEPVQRTIYLGQIDLLLMALVVWDLCQPDKRWLKGVGVGLAAGIKLTPLIFIPYLLVTRRYRQAAVAGFVFALTVAIGFWVLPDDSGRYWFHALFLNGSRAGNVFWNGNQSLAGLISRLTGSTAVQPAWLAGAAGALVLSLACAAVLDRTGHRLLGLATVALAALLISPISWDHHWVWIVLAIPLFVGYAVRLRRTLRWLCVVLGVAVTAIFGAWPTTLWGEIKDYKGWSRGLIWEPPSDATTEYRWHGTELLVGNAYILTGLLLFLLLLAVAAWQVAVRLRRRRRGKRRSHAPAVRPTAADTERQGSRPARLPTPAAGTGDPAGLSHQPWWPGAIATLFVWRSHSARSPVRVSASRQGPPLSGTVLVFTELDNDVRVVCLTFRYRRY
jgi:alpha-1,2-mannosyltransferase